MFTHFQNKQIRLHLQHIPTSIHRLLSYLPNLSSRLYVEALYSPSQAPGSANGNHPSSHHRWLQPRSATPNN
uniref:Uncharacterized protein n=1 Tax=Arundo donax TaxID=35708 RepID=A0A0A8Z2C1_ARUDO